MTTALTSAAPDRTVGRRRPRRNTPLLAAHIVISVGWIGLEVALLALGLTALTAGDGGLRVAAVMLAARLGTWLYPAFSIGALVTGVWLSLRTRWGLLRHWWVVAKLVMNVALVIGGNLVVIPAARRAAGGLTLDAVGRPVGAAASLTGAMTVGMLLLVAATLLSVYKPRGRTPFGTS